ncbi:HNH endonuclease [Ligilactobacillus animalis]|uniref:HNH endonuclease n=2 Tax=Lactobacillales TaxID=186826 RepID=UPI00384E47CC
MCLRSGRYTQATEVHHVLPISQGGTNAQDNLMSLCKPCHSRITAEMDDRWHHRLQTYHY